MKILVAKIGHCWGINLAYSRINDLAAGGDPVTATHRTAGNAAMSRWDPIQRIASDDQKLFNKYPNLRHVTVAPDLAETGDGTVKAIGHQGIYGDDGVAEKFIQPDVYDFKCPFIAKFDEWADRFAEEGYDLIAFGKPKNHHSIYAMAAAKRFGRAGVVAEFVGDILGEIRTPGRNWACLGQVTGNVARWERFQLDLAATGVPVHVHNTICTDSYDRQGEAVVLARESDTVIIVNDNGGATTSVFEQCVAVNQNTYLYDPDTELEDGWLDDARTVAVVGGILVPEWTLKEVASKIRAYQRGNS